MTHSCSLLYRSTLELLELPYLETLRARGAWEFMSLHPPCPTVAHSQWLTGTRSGKAQLPALRWEKLWCDLHSRIPQGWDSPEIPLLVCFFFSSALLSSLPDCFLLGTPISLISHSHKNLHLRICFWGQGQNLRMHYRGCLCRE